MSSDEVVEFKATEEPESLIEQRIEELIKRRRNVCLSKTLINGIVLRRGDIIRLKIKGRGRDEIMAVFDCFNPYYNWLRIIIEDEIIMVKLSEVRYIAVDRKKAQQARTHESVG